MTKTTLGYQSLAAILRAKVVSGEWRIGKAIPSEASLAKEFSVAVGTIRHSDGLLNDLLLKIPQGIEIVIDHFGRPKTNDEFLKNEGGIDKHREHIWVKLSAQYRMKHIDYRAVFQYWLSKPRCHLACQGSFRRMANW